MQVSAKVGLTFAAGLRAMVRADPDVIMVGEIRDRETAQIAVESALTGHLVLSTLHTNDAPSAITRLTEMGIEPFLVASALDCVLAQRLARMLCANCKQRTIIPAEVLRENGYKALVDLEAYEPVGCRRCGGSGYRGRLGIYEVMTLSAEIRVAWRSSAARPMRFARSPYARGCARCATTAWRRSARASPRSPSSHAWSAALEMSRTSADKGPMRLQVGPANRSDQL